jgi:hypothetical protein
MFILLVIGGQPETAQEGFTMLQNNRLTGMLRLDVLAVFVMPLYYLVFWNIYVIQKKMAGTYAALATLLVFAGLTLFLATPSVFSWLSLSDKFTMATSESQKIQLLAAGEAILASDMWHGSGALIGGLLLQSGALLVSILMLNGKTFGKVTAYVGVATHGLDLAHVLVGFISPQLGIIFMAVAGPLYLVWFPFLARDFFRLSRREITK